MFFDFSKYSYYVSPGGTDMRKGAISLSIIVRQSLNLNPMGKSMFLFCSKDRKTLCVLVWDNGFWIMKKRIFQGTYAWPKYYSEALEITVDDVKRIIRGDDIFRKISQLPDGCSGPAFLTTGSPKLTNFSSKLFAK